MVEGDKVDYFGLSGYTNEELREQGYFVWLPVQAKGSWLGEISNPISLSPEFVVPEDAKDGETIHIVFEVTDNGEPSLTRYQRVIITVDEN